MRKFTKIFITILLIFFNFHRNISAKNIKVAIIGRTFNGALCAYYLRELIPKNLDIDIYDNDDLKTEKHTILKFHSLHHEHLKEIISKLNLPTEKFYPTINPIIYNGVDTNHGPMSIELFRKNDSKGLERLKNVISCKYRNFKKIYDLQNIKKQSFGTVKELLKALDPDFINYLTRSVGISSKRWLNLYIDIFLVREYLQGTRVHGFAALSALWFSELHGDDGYLMRFTGTSEEIVDHILNKIEKVEQLNNRILEIVKNENFVTINSKDNTTNVEKNSNYDFVIVAQLKKLKNCKYQEVFITYLEGILNEKCYKDQDPKKVSSIINKFGRENYDRVDKDQSLWRVEASLGYLTPYMIERYFENGYKLKDIDCIKMPSYPDYSNYTCSENASFILGPNVYYANAIEWATNNLEMFAIGAKNVALLIYNGTKGRRSNADIVIPVGAKVHSNKKQKHLKNK